MTNGFTPSDLKYFQKLPAIKKATPTRLYYTEEFQRHCVEAYKLGEPPSRIFRKAGLDPQLIGYKRVERAFDRWLKASDDSSPAAGPVLRIRRAEEAAEREVKASKPESDTQRIIELLSSIDTRLEKMTIILMRMHQMVAQQHRGGQQDGQAGLGQAGQAGQRG